MSVATLVWIKVVTKRPQNYASGDVGSSPDKREPLIVVTADRSGRRLTTASEVVRQGSRLELVDRETDLPSGTIVPDMTIKKLAM